MDIITLILENLVDKSYTIALPPMLPEMLTGTLSRETVFLCLLSSLTIPLNR